MFRKNLSLLCVVAVAALLLPAVSAQAVTIYQDDFNRDGALGGSAPSPVNTPGATWSGGGTTSTTGGGQLLPQGNASLPFTPVVGNVYTLSYKLNTPRTTDENVWGGLGLGSSPNGRDKHWVTEIRTGGSKASPSPGGTVTPLTFGQTYLYQIVLDTQTNPSDWTSEFFLDGVSKKVWNLGAAPDIQTIHISTDGSPFDTAMTEFSLTDSTSDAEPIPEPATMALLGLAFAGLGGYVRRRRKA